MEVNFHAVMKEVRLRAVHGDSMATTLRAMRYDRRGSPPKASASAPVTSRPKQFLAIAAGAWRRIVPGRRDTSPGAWRRVVAGQA